MAYYPYFASQSDEAREKFLAACDVSGVATKPFRCPTSKTAAKSGQLGEDDTAWWIDVADVGRRDAETCLLLSCGLSGSEGFCGSGILVQWLQTGLHTQIPDDVRVILVHGVNPENLMLASESQVVEPTPEVTQTPSWTNRVLAAAEKRFADYTRSHSGKDAETQVRHASPNRWVESVYDAIADDILPAVKRATLIEFHTGLHPVDECVVMSCHQSGSAPDRRIANWFGSDAATTSDGPALADGLLMNLGFHLRNIEFTALIASFGVYSTQSLLSLTPAGTGPQRQLEAQKLFNPNSDNWRKHVCTKANDIIERCAAALAPTA